MTKLLQHCFLFFIVVDILGHNLGNSQVSVYGTIGPTLFFFISFFFFGGGGGGGGIFVNVDSLSRRCD